MTDAVLAARVFDRPHHHSADERGNLLHSRRRRLVPGDADGWLGSVLDRGNPLYCSDRHADTDGLTFTWTPTRQEQRRTREGAWCVSTQGVFRHDIARHAECPGAAAT